MLPFAELSCKVIALTTPSLRERETESERKRIFVVLKKSDRQGTQKKGRANLL